MCLAARTRGADFQSAVSPIFNRHSVDTFHRVRSRQRAAECNSATEQIANLRYAKCTLAASRPNRLSQKAAGGKLRLFFTATALPTSTKLIPNHGPGYGRD